MHRNALFSLQNWLKSNTRRPLVIRGARQVGKSTLVRDFSKAASKNLLEINLEKHVELDVIFKTLDLGLITKNLESILKRKIRDESDLLFLDEIQATPHALASLRYFFEERGGLPVVAAGSLLEFTLSDHSFSMPVGRIEYLHLEPMTFSEFLLAKGEGWLHEQLNHFDLFSPWPEHSHLELLKLYREYLFVGGMPGVVFRYIQKNESATSFKKIQQTIVETYRDDFSKYCNQEQLSQLRQIYACLPAQVGKKIIYSNIARDLRASQLRNSIEMLEQAKIIRRAFHTSGQSVPLSSQVKPEIYKIYWLDCGLFNRILKVDPDILNQDHRLYHEGTIAEQFIAQHLSSLHPPDERPELFYWLREGKKQNSEVDFLIQLGNYIIPLEIKSSKSGSLKSLLQFVLSHQTSIGVKLSAEIPSFQKVRHSVVEGKGSRMVEFTLLNLPLYLIEKLPTVISSMGAIG